MTDMTDKGLFIEETLLNSVKKFLAGRVNELLGEVEDPIPPIELGTYRGGSAVVPVIVLSTCERSEKERIIRVEAYTLTISLSVQEGPDSEQNGYAYAGVVAAALGEDPTLGGVVDRAVLTGKKYIPPEHPGTGEGWEVILTLRIVVEGVGNDN
jgi:hypothetical protein